MSLIGLLILLIIGALCGALAELIVGFSAGGFLASAAVGIVGAFVGTFLARALALPAIFVVRIEAFQFDVVWAVIGAVVLLAILSLFRRRRTVYVRDSYT